MPQPRSLLIRERGLPAQRGLQNLLGSLTEHSRNEEVT
jgi:hypothetical protein